MKIIATCHRLSAFTTMRAVLYRYVAVIVERDCMWHVWYQWLEYNRVVKEELQDWKTFLMDEYQADQIKISALWGLSISKMVVNHCIKHDFLKKIIVSNLVNSCAKKFEIELVSKLQALTLVDNISVSKRFPAYFLSSFTGFVHCIIQSKGIAGNISWVFWKWISLKFRNCNQTRTLSINS
jgi:hypothetical protein